MNEQREWLISGCYNNNNTFVIDTPLGILRDRRKFASTLYNVHAERRASKRDVFETKLIQVNAHCYNNLAASKLSERFT